MTISVSKESLAMEESNDKQPNDGHNNSITNNSNSNNTNNNIGLSAGNSANSSDQGRPPPSQQEVHMREKLFDFIALLQSRRMDDQRATLKPKNNNNNT